MRSPLIALSAVLRVMPIGLVTACGIRFGLFRVHQVLFWVHLVLFVAISCTKCGQIATIYISDTELARVSGVPTPFGPF